MRRREVPDGGVAIMADRTLVLYFWRVLDRLDYWVTQGRLWMADIVRAPFPDCDMRD